MMVKKFYWREAVRFGWTVMKNNIGFFIGFLLVARIIPIIPDIIGVFVKKHSLILYIITNVASSVLYFIIEIGFIRIALKFCSNEKGAFNDLFSCAHLFFKYLFASILYFLIVIGGLILLIVPGIIWAIKFGFYGYFIVDKEIGPIESLKKSSGITRGVKWDLFLFGLLLTGINLLGVLCLLVGLFATIPTTMIATAFVYRTLKVQTEIVPETETSS